MAGSKSKKKFFAVGVGRQTGIFTTWYWPRRDVEGDQWKELTSD